VFPERWKICQISEKSSQAKKKPNSQNIKAEFESPNIYIKPLLKP
jgi:hypothetical protein